MANANGKEAVELQGEIAGLDGHYLNALATVCWLKDLYLFYGKEPAAPIVGEKRGEGNVLPASTIPATLFLALTDRSELAHVPASVLSPSLHVPPTTYPDRVAFWKQGLGRTPTAMGPVIAECARRFRFERETIAMVCRELQALRRAVTAAGQCAPQASR